MGIDGAAVVDFLNSGKIVIVCSKAQIYKRKLEGHRAVKNG